MGARRVLVAVGATAVLISGYVHFYLYFRGGYRGISPDRLVGLDISRSFALNAVAAVVIAEMLVLSLRYPVLQRIGAAAGIAFALGTLGAFAMSRTTGLLGFTEHTTTLEAIVAVASEAVALAALALALRPAPAPIVAQSLR